MMKDALETSLSSFVNNSSSSIASVTLSWHHPRLTWWCAAFFFLSSLRPKFWAERCTMIRRRRTRPFWKLNILIHIPTYPEKKRINILPPILISVMHPSAWCECSEVHFHLSLAEWKRSKLTTFLRQRHSADNLLSKSLGRGWVLAGIV